MEAKIEKKPLEGKFKTWRMRLWKLRDRRLIHYKQECTEWDQCITNKIKLDLDISEMESLDFYPRNNPKPNQLVLKHPELAHGGVLLRFNDKDTEQDTVAAWLKVLTAWSFDKEKNRVYVAIPSNFSFAIWNVLNALYDHPDLLKSEGIFRKETTETRVKHQFCNDLLYEKISLHQLKAGYNMYLDYDNDIYLLANSLKYLLTMLPSSIFGDHNFEQLIQTFQTINIGDKNEDIAKIPSDKLQKLRAGIDGMYKGTRYKHRYGLLCLILHLLKQVTMHKNATRMTYEGMAKMFAICFESKLYSSTQLLTNPLSQFRSVPLVQVLIYHAYVLFPDKEFKMESVVVADESEAKMLERYHELKELNLPKKEKKRLKMQRMKSADNILVHPTQFFDANSTINGEVRAKDDIETPVSPSPPLRPPQRPPPRALPPRGKPYDNDDEEEQKGFSGNMTPKTPKTPKTPSERMAQENKQLHIKTLKLQSEIDKVKKREKDMKFALREMEEQCSALEEQVELKSRLAQKLHQQNLNTQNLKDMMESRLEELETIVKEKDDNIMALQDKVEWMKDKVIAAPIAPTKDQIFHDHSIHGLSLEQKLRQRPSWIELQQRGILMDDPSTTQSDLREHRKLHRRKTSKTLDKMLVNRPNREQFEKQLEDSNILKNAKKREEVNIHLAQRLAQRPDWKEVQQRGILLDNPTEDIEQTRQKRKAHKRNASATLNTLLKTRPGPEQLQSKNIIDNSEYTTYFGGSDHGDNEYMTREEVAHHLSAKLEKRPTMDETMAAGILLYRTDTKQDAWDSDKKVLEDEISLLKKEITDLQERTDELDQVQTQLKTLRDDKEIQQSIAAEELEASRQEIIAHAEQLQLLKVEKQRIMGEYDNAKEKGEQYESEVGKLQVRIKELEGDTNKTQGLETEYNAAIERLEALEQTAHVNETLLSEVAFYKSEKQRIENKISVQENTLQETKELNVELTKTVQNQKKKIQRLSQAFNVSDIEEINNFPEVQQAKEDEWKQQVNRLKDELTQKQMEKTMLQAEKTKLMSRLSVTGYLRSEMNDDGDDDDEDINRNMIAKQLGLFKKERIRINSVMSSYDAPLHEFKCEDVYNKVKWWKYNDVDYESDLERTMKILVNHRLHGDTIHSLRAFNIATMIRNELKTFMTADTMNVMLECLEEWMRIENEDSISGRNAAEIGHMLYHYPLNKLLDRVMSDQIDGEKFTKYYRENNAFMRAETGWKQMEIYQIESILFQHESMKKDAFIANMDEILMNSNMNESICDEIKQNVTSWDVNMIHSYIKRGERHEEFNEKMRSLFNDNEDVYSLIAQCFMWNKDDIARANGSSLRQFDWKCFNCGNDNFCAMIAGKRSIDLSVCTLCGIQEKYSIFCNVRNCDTFWSIHRKDAEDRKDDDDDDAINELMTSVIHNNELNILCVNEEWPECSAVMRLGKCLIKYKRWLDTMGDKADDSNVNIDIESVMRDYHHICKYHMNSKDVFVLFSRILHDEDDDTQMDITNCISCIRRKNRAKQETLSDRTYADIEYSTHNDNDLCNDDVWRLKQQHTLCYLDMIHSYLAHFDFGRFLGSKQQEINVDDHVDFLSYFENNKDKFVTDYGTSISYDHSYLSPRFECIRRETAMQGLSDKQFQDVLTRAIKLLASIDHDLCCNYFDFEYNIIRNSSIGIRHMFVLVMYTDVLGFASAFRSTYTKLDHESDEDEVIERHRALYYYSRALFEAVEFFGTNMTPNDAVYHGLTSYLQSTNMNFSSFGAYFAHPISSTSYYEVAYRFARGNGVILSLHSDVVNMAKYLSVSWLSLFPEEDEKLIYGEANMFKICNIIESKNMNGHEMEFKILHKFQALMRNEDIEWDVSDKMGQYMVDDLVILIKHEQKLDDEIDDEMEENYITDYGKELFHRFCTNTRQIEIKSFKKLPRDLFNALFVDNTQQEEQQSQQLSLIPIMKLFADLQQMMFTDLNLLQLVTNASNYVSIAMQCIDSNSALELIAFKSRKQAQNGDGKQNTKLKKLCNRFKSTQWNMKYDLISGHTHSLMLRHNEYCAIKSMEECSVEQMVYLVSHICDAQEDLMDHTQVFVSWCEENNIDGSGFAKYQNADAFIEAITAINNDRILGRPSQLLFDELKRFSFSTEFAQRFADETERERMENALIVAQLASVEREDKLKSEQQRMTNLQRELEHLKKAMEEMKQLRESNEKEKKIGVALQNELEHVEAQNEEYRQEMKEFEEEKVRMKQAKVREFEQVMTKYKEKEDKLQSEMSELQRNNCNLQEEILKFKETQDTCVAQIDLLTQSKMKLVTSTAAEIDALRHEIKMYNQRNWNALISDIHK